MASVCLFGSHARKTADALSDRDVLVLAANEDESSRIAAEQILNKCNVSLFTHDHFLRMIEVQALFIQHIKQEGQIVRDDEGFMQTALQDFCPKQDYRPECEDAFDHLMSLPTPRGSYWFDLCLSDATYVFFRNAVILHFAGNQKFIFDFSRLVSECSNEFALNKLHEESLRKLRELKHAYRSRQPNTRALMWLPIAREAATLIARRFARTRHGSIETGVTTDAYFQLRKTELELVGKNDPRFLDSLVPGDDLHTEWSLICNPGRYPKPMTPLRNGVELELGVGS